MLTGHRAQEKSRRETRTSRRLRPRNCFAAENTSSAAQATTFLRRPHLRRLAACSFLQADLAAANAILPQFR